MNHLSRLLDEPGTDPLEASLLRLARSEAPSSENRRHILAGLGVGVAAVTLTQTSAAAQHAVGSAARLAALKWGVASVIAVGASVVAFMSLHPHAPLANVGPAAAPSLVVVAERPAAPVVASANLVPITKLEDLPTLAGEASSDTKSVSAPSLAEEVAAIKSAKAALASGSAARSLHELDAYRTRFPHGRLAQEATVVRIEALLKSGNLAVANATADRFLASNAGSPYAARVRTLVGR